MNVHYSTIHNRPKRMGTAYMSCCLLVKPNNGEATLSREPDGEEKREAETERKRRRENKAAGEGNVPLYTASDKGVVLA